MVMQDINAHFDSPLILKISFDKLLKYYETLAQSDDSFLVEKACRVLRAGNSAPELRIGFSDPSLLQKYHQEIKIILEDSFSGILTSNEIKTASMPLHDLIFNTSYKFQSLIENAGDGFQLKIKNMPEHDLYRVACILILHFYYDKKLSFKRPLYYEIPDKKGILRTYKIFYNTEFAEILKTDAAPLITEEDYKRLLDNAGDIELWRKKFPPQSYIFKGFTINNIFDVTDDRSISDIISTLLVSGKRHNNNFIEDFRVTFEALFGVKNLKIGFVLYDKNLASLKRVDGTQMVSYLIPHLEPVACETVLSEAAYASLIVKNNHYAVSDVERCYKTSHDPFYRNLYGQGIRSAIFVPLSSQAELLGVLEIASYKPHELNSINANVLEDVMPFLISTLLRSKEEEENLIEAVIQQECTSIHPSVSWKFEDAARVFLDKKSVEGRRAAFDEIIFADVYPLFGQIDVQRSSETRNEATRQDVLMQLKLAKEIIENPFASGDLTGFKKLLQQLDLLIKSLKNKIRVDSEQEIVEFLKTHIHPAFHQLNENPNLNGIIGNYFSKLDPHLGLFYHYRKNYDDTISLINKNMSQILDQKQVEAQKMYPHYFERYKTDGVEHNMYIGESITKQQDFHLKYLYNMQLWQLQVMCEMENEFYYQKEQYPTSVDVASMVFVFDQPLTIQFRVDEKRFDVYGSYNARYEIIKKRVDKAFIKGTSERVTQKGKLSIIYSQKKDEVTYLQYIKFLQAKKCLEPEMEFLDLADMQGVTGLKAIRVPINYDHSLRTAYFTYSDLLTWMNS